MNVIEYRICSSALGTLKKRQSAYSQMIISVFLCLSNRIVTMSNGRIKKAPKLEAFNCYNSFPGVSMLLSISALLSITSSFPAIGGLGFKNSATSGEIPIVFSRS